MLLKPEPSADPLARRRLVEVDAVVERRWLIVVSSNIGRSAALTAS